MLITPDELMDRFVSKAELESHYATKEDVKSAENRLQWRLILLVGIATAIVSAVVRFS